VLIRGNQKLGRTIWQWSIPAVSTCPGRSLLCENRCYATKGFFCMPAVKLALVRNLEMTKLDDFVPDMIAEIKKKNISTVRIHVSGDMYSVEYIKKWHEIVKQSPNTRFFIYTRSWRIPAYREALIAFAKQCKNVRMWWSLDSETGYPSRVPKCVKTCYMSVADNDDPDQRSHLVFRDYPIRASVRKKINGVFVCPPENGITDLTCEKCGYCFNKQTLSQPTNNNNRRLSLELAA
jgi:Gene product 88